MRAYRAAPGATAALIPVPIAARPLLERAHEALAGLQARLPGGGGISDASLSQVAVSGGARGAGAAGLAKVLAICAGTAGSAAVCVSAGLVPAVTAPVGADRTVAPKLVERTLTPHADWIAEPPLGRADPGPDPKSGATPGAKPEPDPEPVPQAPAPGPVEEPLPAPVAPSAEVAVPAESAPPPEPPPAPSPPTTGGAEAASAAGEFGP